MIILPDEDFDDLKLIFVKLGAILRHADNCKEEQSLIGRQEKLIAPLILAAKAANTSPQIEHIEGENDDMPKKLKYGKGTICQRQRMNKNGKIRRFWQGRIYHNGKQIPVYASTQAECLQKMEALRDELKGAQAILPDAPAQAKAELQNSHPTTFGKWLDEWLKEFKENTTRPKYFKDLRRYVSKLKAALGDMKLKQMDSMTLQRYINSLPRTNATVKLYGVLKDSLQRAEDFGIIKKNPCKVIEKPKYKQQKRRPFELEEQNAILNALPDRYKAVFFFLCSTGLRIGEFLALTPQKVDFDRMCLHVTEDQDLETREKDDTKTEASVRKVYFAKELFENFDITTLGSYSYNAIKKAFTKVYDALHVEGVSATHSCRHTFASLLYATRVPEKVIQAQCGHSDVNTTMKIYTDILIRGESPIYNYILRLKEVLAKRYQIW